MIQQYTYINGLAANFTTSDNSKATIYNHTFECRVQIEQNYTPHNVTHHSCHALSVPSLEIFIFIKKKKGRKRREKLMRLHLKRNGLGFIKWPVHPFGFVKLMVNILSYHVALLDDSNPLV